MGPSMRPVMRGTLSADEAKVGGALVFEGRWTMREADLDKKDLCAPFRYERTGALPPKNTADGGSSGDDRSGLFSGFFDVQSGPSQPANKFAEKNIIFEFAKVPGKSRVQVSGSGVNKLGKFALSGELDEATGTLTIFREYAPRRRAANTQSRKQRELGMLGSGANGGGGSSEVSAVETPAPRGQRNARLQASAALALPQREPLPAAAAAPAAASAAAPETSVPDVSATESEKALLEKLAKLLDQLMADDAQRYFCTPVDAERLGLLDYHDIVASPMDLGTVKERMAKGHYADAVSMQKDIELTFSNALLYNARGSAVYKKASELAAAFDRGLRELLQISTPRCALGKRQTIPKVAFEVVHEPTTANVPKRVKRSHSSNSAGTQSAASNGNSRKHKHKQPVDEDEEVARLRAQVASMSQDLQRLQGGEALLTEPISSAATKKRTTKAERARARAQTLYEMKRRLGRDINFLNGDKLRRILDIISEAGIDLPVTEFGEIELDIDLLDEDTLQRVRKYVTRQLQAIQPNYRP